MKRSNDAPIFGKTEEKSSTSVVWREKMIVKTREKITGALRVIHHEVCLETNRVERIKALIREYVSEELKGDESSRGKRRRSQIEEELRRFASRKE